MPTRRSIQRAQKQVRRLSVGYICHLISDKQGCAGKLRDLPQIIEGPARLADMMLEHGSSDPRTDVERKQFGDLLAFASLCV